MSGRAWLLFAAVTVVWGVPYFFIKVAVDADISPAFVAWSRVALAAGLLLPLAQRRGSLRGLGGHWRPITAYAACEIAVPFVLIPMGEQHISSSLTAILIASMPLMVALLSVRFAKADKATGLRLIGLFIGFGGVVALLGIDVAGKPNELLGAGLILVATTAYATAVIIINRWLADLDPLGPVAVGLCLSAIALLPAAVAALPEQAPTPQVLWSLGALGVVCTALGLVLFFGLVTEAGPSRAALITYTNPVVAVALGVLILDEHLGPTSVIGLLAILAGSWLATGGRPRPVRRHARAEAIAVDTDGIEEGAALRATDEKRGP
jgi:drug/metabolite transporter (DMT)-like permease